MVRKSKWTVRQLVVVRRFMSGGHSRTAAEVYQRLNRARIVGGLTTADVRRLLDKEYARRGQKRCSISHRSAICWVKRPPKARWIVGPHDGTLFVEKTGGKYD